METIYKKDWTYLEDNFDWVRMMKDVPQDPRHHAEGNVAVHTQMVLQQLEQLPAFSMLTAADQQMLWVAALLHDVEKSSTTIIAPDGSITSAGHARKGEMKARQILYRDIPAPFVVREHITKLVRYHGLPLWIFEKEDTLRSLIVASLETDTRLLALLARADALGRICQDQEDLLYRIDCFEQLCHEHNCWGRPYDFANPHARMYYLQQADRSPFYVPHDMPAMEVVLMSGLPGAGKDTYTRKHCAGLPVVSLDNIRKEMKIDPTDKSGNGTVIQIAKERARSFLRVQQSFVWNATNITKQMREQVISLFLEYGAWIKIVYVEAPVAKLLQQNRQREEVVPAVVMERLISKLEVPVITEAHEVEYLGI
ncbi:MAG TPA: AAA family ATPase [Chitinophaga sp.]|uniref:AAA family ATPase n=1 Tax=Chitinophaga sp. TaxID=1869181 RepID=UPI002C99C2A8|nr:AAA family ATPase [Chitinophaga sp.]HVI46473.1 AAA family ATPase [Chitinophaga sp.]